eukprot:29463-Pyramimonas_sp.AAC.1
MNEKRKEGGRREQRRRRRNCAGTPSSSESSRTIRTMPDVRTLRIQARSSGPIWACPTGSANGNGELSRTS